MNGRMIRAAAIPLLLVGGLALTLTPADVAGSWVTERLTPDEGEMSSVAIDSQGFAHVSFYNRTSGDLLYARDTASGWSVELVDEEGDSGLWTAIALDSQDNPRISYFSASTGELRLAEGPAGSWSIEPVDTTTASILLTSLTLDGAGEPHIAYYDDGPSHLRYAFRTGGAGGDWTRETVDSEGTVGDWPSIALGSDGQPRISYAEDDAVGNLRLATRTGPGAWVVDEVDPDVGPSGGMTSLVLGAGDAPHISYSSGEDEDWQIRYATPSSADSGWTVELVDDVLVGTEAGYTSIAIDGTGRLHLSYYSGAGETQLRYAFREADGWVHELVDDSGNVGRWSSLALGDGARITYYDATLAQLGVAERRFPGAVLAANTAPRSPFSAGPNYPDPFNPYTRIPLVADAPLAIFFSVYDAAGRIVTGPIPHVLDPGRHDIVWDGVSNAGLPLPSAVYYYEVRTDRGGRHTGSMVLLK